MKDNKIKRTVLTRMLVAAAMIAVCLALSACGGEKIVWEDIILGDMLPQPPADKGEVHTNAANSLWLDISDLSDKQFADYVEACKEKGFTVDAESSASSYSAFNEKGYELDLSHYGGRWGFT